ncbi:MAG: SPOR domain-containing protein, partial [Pseudomonadales bacterium]|nr:SPOR domain-containing protein [Pseudomonadales bacterium]
SFSDAANADNLLARLQDAGYRAYTRAIVSDQGNLTGVFVGPWLDRARVESYQQELQARFQLAGMVVRYRIED